MSGCGFQPIYKYQGDAPTISVAELTITGDGAQRDMARHLDKSIRRGDATARVHIALTQNAVEMQKSADGVARRLQLTHRAAVTMHDATAPQVFAVTQYMTRSDSAADELSQRRALTDLATRELAEQIIAFLTSRLQAEAR